MNWMATTMMTGMISEHDQRQLPVDAPHEEDRPSRCWRMAQTTSSIPQVTNSATRSVSEVTRDMIQPTGVLVVVGQRQRLQVAEHVLAQVVAHPLAQDAGQVDEAEDRRRLDQDQRRVVGRRCAASLRCRPRRCLRR